jgi:hypothetical protein
MAADGALPGRPNAAVPKVCLEAALQFEPQGASIGDDSSRRR